MPRTQAKRRATAAADGPQLQPHKLLNHSAPQAESPKIPARDDITIQPTSTGLCCGRVFCCALLATVLTVAFLPLLADVLDPNDALQSRVAAAFSQDGDDDSSSLVQPSMPGRDLASRGARAHHPIVIIPGITSTPLEVWAGKPCMARHVRSRVWGEGLMLQKILLNPLCWFEHIMLNETTGLDPDDIKLRASSGLRSLETLADAFTLWGALLLNAAELGYDESNLHVATYDWRLAFPQLEERDGYFTRLKLRVEEMYELNGQRPVVIVAHSMGSLVFLYFQQWVSAHGVELLSVSRAGLCNASTCYRPSECGGDGTSALTQSQSKQHADTCAACNCTYASWVDKYVHAFVNVAGPLLGTPKAIPAILSGEMRTTADMPAAFAFVKEAFISRAAIRSAFRSFGSMASMWPMGGNRFWGGEVLDDGSVSAAPDQEDGMPNLSSMLVLHSPTNDTEGAMSMIRVAADGALDASKAALAHMLGALHELQANSSWEAAMARWRNSTAAATASPPDDDVRMMPHVADAMHPAQVCLTTNEVMRLLESTAPAYAARLHALVNVSASRPEHAAAHPGTRAVHAGRVAKPFWMNALVAPLPVAPRTRIYCLYGVGKPAERAYHYTNVAGESEFPMAGVIATAVSNASQDIIHGVQVVDGDAAVSLLSLGYMCVRGWTDRVRNPGGSALITREYKHLEIDMTASQPVPNAPTSSMHGGSNEVDGSTLLTKLRETGQLLATLVSDATTTTSSMIDRRTILRAVLSVLDVLRALSRQGAIRGALNVLRGHASADHVDVLLNARFLTDVLKIATATAADVTDDIISKVRQYASNVRDVA